MRWVVRACIYFEEYLSLLYTYIGIVRFTQDLGQQPCVAEVPPVTVVYFEIGN